MGLGYVLKKLHLVIIGAFAWYSVKIRDISVVSLKGEKLTKANLHDN